VTEERNVDDGGRGAHPVTVFVSDPTAEAERMAQALRGAGYTVVDVPLSMLIARVAVQRPRVILVDSDAEGAIEAVSRVHEVADLDEIDVLFLGQKGEASDGLPANEDALSREGSGFFGRPVDVDALLRKIALLTGGPNGVRVASSPPSRPSSRSPLSGAGTASLPPASMRSAEIHPLARNTPAPRNPIPSLGATTSLLGMPAELAPPSLRKTTSLQAPLSGELEALLAEAEQRIGGQFSQDSMLPSPEEEIEAVLPADVLASLDEPIDDDEDDAVLDPHLAAVHRASDTGAGQSRATTGADTGAGTPPVPRAKSSRPNAVDQPSIVPKTHGGTSVGSTGASTTGASMIPRTQARSLGPADFAPREIPISPPVIARTERRSPIPPAVILSPVERPERPAPPIVAANDAPPMIASVLGPTDAPRLLAAAIGARETGVMAFQSPGGVRRVVLREGDVVTAASALDEESLLPFLAARGELPRDRVAQLAGKVPAAGRHAGAALVAHGYMRQDQLWTVLRAHAEWVLGRVVAQTTGTAGFEADPPGRLKSEPSVFGGATGAEVFVEAVRRQLAPLEAIARLGGDASRIVEGPNARIESECALGASESSWLRRARGQTIGDAMASAGDPDFAAVLYALVALGVCETIRAVGAPAARVPPAPESDPLDEEAIRARVRARLQIVEEGDYFAVLGVSRDATSYEVKRAFLELRRTFEPSKLLTPALGDLVDDVRKIAVVLDEAYEILRDAGRRERYRKAIDASPR
jgi:hypothetical protein